jgi:hypothetical protein
VGVFEVQLTRQFIVFFVEGATGDEDAYAHVLALSKVKSIVW